MTGRADDHGAGRDAAHVARWVGWACVAAGASLAARRGRLAVSQGLATTAVALAGIAAFDLLYARRPPSRRRASRQLESDGSLRLVQSLAVLQPPRACYDFVRDLQQLSRLLPDIEPVEPVGDGRRTRWRTGRGGEWHVELSQDDAPSLIAWQARAADLVVDGSVRFITLAQGDGTLVRVVLRYLPAAGVLGDWAGRLVGVGPEPELKQALRRLKQMLETGEILAVEGQPRGPGRQTMTRLLSAA